MIPGSRWQSDSRPVLASTQPPTQITLDTTLQWAANGQSPVQSEVILSFMARN